MAHISTKNLGSKTNGQRALTFFNITRGPEGGLIYMNDAPASVFGQVNIYLFNHDSILIYKLTNFTKLIKWKC